MKPEGFSTTKALSEILARLLNWEGVDHLIAWMSVKKRGNQPYEAKRVRTVHIIPPWEPAAVFLLPEAARQYY